MTDVQPPDEVTVTRSEERLRVGTRAIAVGRAILRRRVVTEERTITVRVRHEEAELEIVPFDEPVRVDDGRGAAHLANPGFTLYREEIVITTRLVPVERVRLDIRTVTEQRSVTAAVRAERISLDGDDAGLPADSHAGSPLNT